MKNSTISVDSFHPNDMPQETDDENSMLSIGAVSEATDIPTSTLRTWERRYGFPNPKRTDSGHRRYEPGVIGRLKLVHEAVENGHRPSDVIELSVADLRELLDYSRLEDRSDEQSEAEDDWMESWREAVWKMDGRRYEKILRQCWHEMGSRAFLQNRIAPFIKWLGEAWRAGNLEIAHEHFAAQLLQSFLSSKWRQLSMTNDGPPIIIAALPEEEHALGLHMTAFVCALEDWSVTFLGPNTPVEDIVRTAVSDGAEFVGIGLSENYDTEKAKSHLRRLKQKLPRSTKILAGGRGAPMGLEGIETLHSIEQLRDRL